MSYTCQLCGSVSHNPNDEANRYCGACHTFAEACNKARGSLGHYILDDHGNPIEEPDLMTWARWLEESRDKRIVEQTETKLHWISTVFLSLDHSYGDGPPVLWETMVFTRDRSVSEFHGRLHSHREEIDQWRYSTRDEAEAGHAATVRKYQKLEADAEAMTTQ